MVVLNISENSPEGTCGGVLFWKSCCILIKHLWIAVSKFIRNLHVPHLYMVIRGSGWQDSQSWKLIFLLWVVIAIVRYGFVGLVDSQSILIIVNIISSCSLYVLHLSIFYSIYSFQLTWIVANIPKEDYSKTLLNFFQFWDTWECLKYHNPPREKGKSCCKVGG